MSKSGRIVRPSQTTGRYSPEDLDFAGQSARAMVAQSRILQTIIATMIASRRIYMIARSALDNEVLKGWECEDPELILHTLVLSAQEKANEKFHIAELHQQCMGTVAPFLDIVLQQSVETGEDICGNANEGDTHDTDPSSADAGAADTTEIDGPILLGGDHQDPA